MDNKIYLDHASTSLMHPEVIEVMIQSMKKDYGNASSIHAVGRNSSGKLDNARITFAKSINADPNDIIITSGGTESDNTAIIKMAEHNQDKGKHIITTGVEHHAVLNPMKYLQENGFEVTYLPVDENGFVAPQTIKEALREDTILVSIMYANNEVGSIMPISEIAEIVKENSNAYFHTDAVQAYGSQHIDVKEMQIDLLSVSAHKINGPKGVGFLYKRSDILMPSFVLGGNQESKHRAGTENTPAIVGFDKAVQIIQENQEANNEKYQAFKKQMVDYFIENNIEFEVNGVMEEDRMLPHIFSVHFPGVESEKLLIQLDLMGVQAAAGSACTAGVVEPSHVLEAMFGEDSPKITETVRFSFGYGLTDDDLDSALDKVKKAVTNLKGR